MVLRIQCNTLIRCLELGNAYYVGKQRAWMGAPWVGLGLIGEGREMDGAGFKTGLLAPGKRGRSRRAQALGRDEGPLVMGRHQQGGSGKTLP